MSSTCRDHGAHGACSRCGTFVCPACRRWSRERPYCAACHARVGGKPSARAMMAIVLSTLGFGCLVPGALGALLGGLELAAIRRGEAPSSGETFARLAVILGALESAALLVWAVLALA